MLGSSRAAGAARGQGRSTLTRLRLSGAVLGRVREVDGTPAGLGLWGQVFTSRPWLPAPDPRPPVLPWPGFPDPQVPRRPQAPTQAVVAAWEPLSAGGLQGVLWGRPETPD